MFKIVLFLKYIIYLHLFLFKAKLIPFNNNNNGMRI